MQNRQCPSDGMAYAVTRSSSDQFLLTRCNPIARDILGARYLPDFVKWMFGKAYIRYIQWWNDRDGDRMACYISALNLSVHLLWRVPRLRPFMLRHFVHDPQSGKWYTLVTTVFR